MKLALAFWIERNIHIDCVSSIKIELRWSDVKGANSYRSFFSLPAIIFISFAKEFKSTIATIIYASESHINTITKPTIQTIHRIDEVNHRRITSCSYGKLKCPLFSYKSDHIIEICKTRSLEDHSHRYRHSSCEITRIITWVFNTSKCKNISCRRYKLYSLFNWRDVCNFDQYFINIVDLIICKSDTRWFNSETCLFHTLFCF